MSHYRGYFMQDENIVAPANIDATDDAGALVKASELLSAGQFLRVEVWQGPRIVGGLSSAQTLDMPEATIRLHRERLAMMVEEQAARVERLRRSGIKNENSERLLELLRESELD